MNKSQQSNFNKFKEAVLEYQTITIDELYMILNRVTWQDKKVYLGFNQKQRFDSRLRYNRYFIKMLEGQGVIEQMPEYLQRWRIIETFK